MLPEYRFKYPDVAKRLQVIRKLPNHSVVVDDSHDIMGPEVICPVELTVDTLFQEGNPMVILCQMEEAIVSAPAQFHLALEDPTTPQV